MITTLSTRLASAVAAFPSVIQPVVGNALCDITIILAAALLAAYVARSLKIPDVILFLLAGIVLGPAVPAWVPIKESSPANQLVVVFGASYILFQGGMGLSLRMIGRYLKVISLLSIPGVLLSTVIIGFFARLLFPVLSWPLALLLGAILSPTDPATLIPVLQQVKVSKRLTVVIASESAFNDAIGAILFVTIAGVIQKGDFSFGSAAAGFLREILIGGCIGAGLGILAGFTVFHRTAGIFRDFASILTLPIAAGAFIVSERFGGNGYIAAFLAGIFLGGCCDLFPGWFESTEIAELSNFSSDVALVSRMMIFVILGSQIDFPMIAAHWLPGLALIGAFILLSRPAVVFGCLGFDRRNRWTLREKLFLSWIRETGVMPAALAGTLASLALTTPSLGRDRFPALVQGMVFIAILATLLIQALSTPWVARKLSLTEPDE